MNTELKVSFYLKREQSKERVTANFNPAYPIV
ncbi:Tyrosine recombinase XerC, partial [termite gut metagenome]